MKGLSLLNIAKIVGGKLTGRASNLLISAISIDSRTIVDPASTLFFAISGQRHDGHDYLPELYAKGVRCFVVSSDPGTFSDLNESSFIQVEDSLNTLQNLAAWVRRQYQYPVVAITGSNGKTIVKEWLADLLPDKKIIRSPKSYNSQVGVPLSVFGMDDHFELAVFEAGISQPGEMERLANVIAPDLGIFTNVGDAHQENFLDLEQKVLEKLKLFSSCKTLIYRADQVLVSRLINERFKETGTKLFSWSFKDRAASLFFDLQKDESASTFKFQIAGNEWSICIPFTDDASVENAGHCLAFIVSQNLLDENSMLLFECLQPIAMRLELKDGINNCTLINDYYNSDIKSLEIALQFLKQQTSLNHKKKTVILSDIKQSGLSNSELEQEVMQLLSLIGIDRFIAIGKEWTKGMDVPGVSISFYDSTSAFLDDFNSADFRGEIILIKGARDYRFERISSALQKKYHQTSLEVRLYEMVENLNAFKALLKPDTKVMVMVKAFSYGSGTIEVARMLEYQKVDYLAVAVADEGIELRQAGIETPIVVMNPEEHSFETMIEFRLEPNIYSEEVFNGFERTARQLAVLNYPIHLKIDTGMHRLGFDSVADFEPVVNRLADSDLLRVKSIFSHLAASDDPQHDEFTVEQGSRFGEMHELLASKLPYNYDRHILNSAGIERFPDMQMEMVRLGIGLYGGAGSSKIQCRPIAYWVTTISQIRYVQPGETVGYSRMGKVPEFKKVAVLPVGYADGYDRRFSNGVAKVWVNGRFAPVIGNVCMDMCMIDVTDIQVSTGDTVELMGEHVTLRQLAEWAGTIPYEILTGISQRVKRIYIQE